MPDKINLMDLLGQVTLYSNMIKQAGSNHNDLRKLMQSWKTLAGATLLRLPQQAVENVVLDLEQLLGHLSDLQNVLGEEARVIESRMKGEVVLTVDLDEIRKQRQEDAKNKQAPPKGSLYGKAKVGVSWSGSTSTTTSG